LKNENSFHTALVARRCSTTKEHVCDALESSHSACVTISAGVTSTLG